LPSQLQPDPAWLPTAETSVFAGNSLEDAIDEARAYLGSGAQIRAARRVKQGLRGRVRFEVLAAPAPASAMPQP
jgi:flagellar biosynthesis GTPase FlhF